MSTMTKKDRNPSYEKNNGCCKHYPPVRFVSIAFGSQQWGQLPTFHVLRRGRHVFESHFRVILLGDKEWNDWGNPVTAFCINEA